MARARSGACLIWIVAAGVLGAQYPGRDPSSTPFPRLPFPGRGKKTAGDKKPDPKEVLLQFTGAIDTIEPESFTIIAPDTRILTFKCTKITKYVKEGNPVQRSLLKSGDRVGIEARKDDQGYFYAVNVSLEKPAPAPAAPPSAAPTGPSAAPPRETSSTIQRPPAAIDPDDEGPPKLRRGKPAPRPRKAEPDPEPEAAPVIAGRAPATQPPIPLGNLPSQDDLFIAKAVQTAGEFSESLPNYICRQLTTRYQGEGRPVRWQPLDVVTAAVVYEGGKESYHDIRINNKPVNKPMEQIQGSWSRGEFGTTLRDLFSPATAADFRHRRDSTAAGRAAAVYDFSVEQPNSHWQTILGGQSVMPAYKGSVWIDKKTYRVLRIEMQARKVPEEFPLDTIEWVVDYSYVRIGTTNEYLLPVHGENLSCWRGSTQCVRNALDFRNYRKFTSESQIMTTDSTISFEEEAKPAAKKP